MDRASKYFECMALVVPESEVSRMSVKKAAAFLAQLPFDYEEFTVNFNEGLPLCLHYHRWSRYHTVQTDFQS